MENPLDIFKSSLELIFKPKSWPDPIYGIMLLTLLIVIFPAFIFFTLVVGIIDLLFPERK